MVKKHYIGVVRGWVGGISVCGKKHIYLNVCTAAFYFGR